MEVKEIKSFSEDLYLLYSENDANLVAICMTPGDVYGTIESRWNDDWYAASEAKDFQRDIDQHYWVVHYKLNYDKFVYEEIPEQKYVLMHVPGGYAQVIGDKREEN